MSIGFALTLLLLGGILPAAGMVAAAGAAPDRLPPAATAQERFSLLLDHDGNGVEDALDAWLAGGLDWAGLRDVTRPVRSTTAMGPEAGPDKAAGPRALPAAGPMAAGRLRLLCLGRSAGRLAGAREAADRAGTCRVLQGSDHFGGFAVLDVDAAGLRAFLQQEPGGLLLLDRDGTPALVNSRQLVGVGRVAAGELALGDDWSATVAIIDSGLDTAHGDLGDATDDDVDGPPPGAGDSADWADAAGGWPLFDGFKAMGWHDVTNDFPAAAGPWDYHYHGTALASVVAGSGRVDVDYRGVAPGGRLTVVKFYDFDETWHTWAGDFLAACAWVLDHRDLYRVRTVLSAVNWEVDAGISTAMTALIDAGLLPISAMGNFGSDPAGPGFPAVLPDVLTVGAVNAAGAVAAYSGRGRPGDAKPDLVAPGGGLLIPSGRIVAADNEPDDTYSGRFGTSLAAAHVAGAAYLLEEALFENGMPPARDRGAAVARATVLKMATAFVPLAETADGTGTFGLPGYGGQEAARGWGHVRVDAAVRALTDPLMPGQDQADTLSSDWRKPVVARRLAIGAGVRYLIEAVPSGSLDIALEVVEVDGETGLVRAGDLRMNANGPGVSEFIYHRPDAGTWCFLVVRRIAGAGSINLHLHEADTFPQQGAGRTLPGLGTGAPNVADLPAFAGPSLVVPSQVLVDPVARSLNVLDLSGDYRPGWPVFVFPAGSAQGGLTQPMVANVDAVPGDEIVVASDYGSVYFFTGSGSYKTVALTLNRELTAPVGFRNGAGGWRMLVVDKTGWARTWSWNAAVGAQPELRAEAALGHASPLAPAAGNLLGGAGESVVIAFADGWLGAFDDQLNLLDGWPLDLGPGLEVAPVLCDLDADDRHEIIVPVRDPLTGQLRMRVFDGTAAALPQDGALVPPPRGGRWLAVSGAAVSGRYDTGELNVAVVGLADNGLLGDQAVWSLGLGRLYADGGPAVTDLQGFAVRATTGQGELRLDRLLLPAPLAWNRTGGSGTELATLFHAAWFELLYGLTSIPGTTTGWLDGDAPQSALARKQPLLLGGSQQPAVSHLGAMLVPLGNGAHLRVDVVDRQLGITPVLAGSGEAALWRAQRGDARNSGAYPLKTVAAAAPAAAPVLGGLRAYPNPGSERIRFRADTGTLPGTAQLEIFDLRGHLVRRLAGADADGILQWDGRDRAGRRLAAGTYLAVVRTGGSRLTTRVVLTR